MADRILKLRRLKEILRTFGIEWNEQKGKGSHGSFWKKGDGGFVSYPVPTTRDDILICYVRGCRKKFKLTAEDGVSDNDFYNA